MKNFIQWSATISPIALASILSLGRYSGVYYKKEVLIIACIWVIQYAVVGIEQSCRVARNLIKPYENKYGDWETLYFAITMTISFCIALPCLQNCG